MNAAVDSGGLAKCAGHAFRFFMGKYGSWSLTDERNNHVTTDTPTNLDEKRIGGTP